jgi:hypothetical protein
MVLCLVNPALARAQNITCIQKHVASVSTAKSLGFTSSDVESLIAQLMAATGLQSRGVTVVPCDTVVKAQAAYYDNSDVPKGEYILYEPQWVHEVIGPNIAGSGHSRNRDEAIVLFGHEVGHLMARHFTTNVDLARPDKELAADAYAACAAARLGALWEHISGLLMRIRPAFDGEYPSASRSIATARTNYDRCSPSQTRSPAHIRAAAPSLLRRTVLWVDDNPAPEDDAALRSGGLEIVRSPSTEDALDRLSLFRFEVMVSDMKRGADDEAGFGLFDSLPPQSRPDRFVIYCSPECESHFKLRAQQKGIVITSQPAALKSALVGAPTECSRITPLPQLGYKSGSKSDFCRARGYAGMTNYPNSSYRAQGGGFCYSGNEKICLMRAVSQ